MKRHVSGPIGTIFVAINPTKGAAQKPKPAQIPCHLARDSAGEISARYVTEITIMLKMPKPVIAREKINIIKLLVKPFKIHAMEKTKIEP